MMAIEPTSLIIGIAIGLIGMGILVFVLRKPKKKYNLSALNKITANIEIDLKQAYMNVEKLAGYFKEIEKG